MDSVDLGRVVDAYRNLAKFYEIMRKTDFDISLYKHRSILDLRSRMESPADMALAIICNESTSDSFTHSNYESLKNACFELARATDRLG